MTDNTVAQQADTIVKKYNLPPYRKLTSIDPAMGKGEMMWWSIFELEAIQENNPALYRQIQSHIVLKPDRTPNEVFDGRIHKITIKFEPFQPLQVSVLYTSAIQTGNIELDQNDYMEREYFNIFTTVTFTLDE